MSQEAFLRTNRSSKFSRRAAKKRCNLHVEELEKRELLATTLGLPIHFDFGTATSPVAIGDVGISPVAYTLSRGYGWSSLSGISAYDRGTVDLLTRDFNAGHNGTFLVNLPNGTYSVTANLGDAKAPMGLVTMWLEGQKAFSSLMTQGGQFVSPTYRVQVSDGQLSVRLLANGASNSRFALDGLDIIPISTSPPPVANAGPYLTASEGAAAGNAVNVGMMLSTGPRWA